MGLVVSSIDFIQPSISGYHLYLVKDYYLEGVAKDLSESFLDYAERLGRNSVIIRGTDPFLYGESVHRVFESDPWFIETLGYYFALPPGVLITKPSLQLFSCKKGQVFIYVSGDVINKAYFSKTQLSQDIVDLCRHEETRFISKIKPFSRSSIVMPKLRTVDKLQRNIKKAVLLQPNINGIGIDLKKLSHKEIAPYYNCVIKIY